MNARTFVFALGFLLSGESPGVMASTTSDVTYLKQTHVISVRAEHGRQHFYVARKDSMSHPISAKIYPIEWLRFVGMSPGVRTALMARISRSQGSHAEFLRFALSYGVKSEIVVLVRRRDEPYYYGVVPGEMLLENGTGNLIQAM